MGGNSPRGMGRPRRRAQSRQIPTRTHTLASYTAAASGFVLMLWLLATWRPGHPIPSNSCNLMTDSESSNPKGDADPTSPIPGTAGYKGPFPEHPERYTLLLNSYKRPDLLLRSVAHYSQCPEADAIRVIWSEPDLQPPPSDALDGTFQAAVAGGGGSGSGVDGGRNKQRGRGGRSMVPVAYDVQPDASLNNRFRPLPGIRTAAILSLDDDVMVPCTEVAAAFAVWRRRPAAMVGWFPRGVAPGWKVGSQLGGCGGYHYLSRDQSVLLRGSYSMVLSKGAFLHRDYLQHYTDVMPAGIRAHVDTHRNCEDIAMAFLIANVTAAPPEYVRSPSLRDLGQGIFKVKGISSIGGHAAQRTACVNEFLRLYGRMPLVQRQLSSHQHPWRMRLSTLADRSVG